MTVSLEISYPLEFYPHFDKKIKDVVGWDQSASGAGFGERDLAFEFETTETAVKLGERLLHKLPELIRIHVQEWKDENWHDIKTIKG